MPKFNFNPILFSIALAMLFILIAIALLPAHEDFLVTNPYWNGLETFSKTVDLKVINIEHKMILPEKTILFLIGPSLNITRNQIETLREYVMNGGELVLMDETGIINALLSSLGLGISVDGNLMLDALFYHRGWKLPRITNIEEDKLTAEVESIVLDLPSVLRISDPRAKLIAYSSSFSFLDLNKDFKPSDDEPLGPFPVAAKVSYGKGVIMIFSDSSIFLNSIINLGDNLKLLQNMVKDRSVYLDISAWKLTPRESYRNALLSFYAILLTPEIKYGLALAMLAIIYAIRPRGKAKEMDEIEEILKKHPDWDGNLLKLLKELRNKYTAK